MKRFTKAQKVAFDRFWTRACNAGIPVSGFELAVVMAHAESAFLSGFRAAKARKKKQRRRK